jgi:putative lipoic acid-binding regulatory protein
VNTVEYPATFHFRVIVEPAAFSETDLAAALTACNVVESLVLSRASQAGRYRAYGVSIEFQDKEGHHAFDAALKRVPGVRMVL